MLPLDCNVSTGPPVQVHELQTLEGVSVAPDFAPICSSADLVLGGSVISAGSPQGHGAHKVSRVSGLGPVDGIVSVGEKRAVHLGESTESAYPRARRRSSVVRHVQKAKHGMKAQNGTFSFSQSPKFTRTGRNFGAFADWASHRFKEGSFSKKTGSWSDKTKASEKQSRSKNPVLNTIALLIFVLLFGNLLVQVVVRWGLDPTFHDANKEEYFQEIDSMQEIYEDIAEEVIPPMKMWYRALPDEKMVFGLPGVELSKRQECAEYWHGVMLAVTNNQTHTNPKTIKYWLRMFGLHENPVVTKAVGSMLFEPRKIAAMLRRGAECSGENRALGSFLCDAMDDPTLRLFQTWSDTELRTQMLELMNLGALIEELSSKAAADSVLNFEVFNYALNGVMHEVLDDIKDLHKDMPAYRDFLIQKYTGIASAGFGVAVKRLGNVPSSVIEDGFKRRSSMQINILEAANLDRARGFDNNTRVGVALAAATRWGAATDDHERLWMMGRQWLEAYNTWNLAFTTTIQVPQAMVKLLIPSIACVGEEYDADRWYMKRLFSLQLTLFLSGKRFTLPAKALKKWHNPAVTAAMGARNRAHVEVNRPFADQVERMLSELCNGKCHGTEQLSLISNTVITAPFDLEGFRCYAGILLWCTVMIAGFGTEFFVANTVLLGELGDDQLEKLQTGWLFVQFIFSLFLSIALGCALTQNYLGLPFLVLGLWKFGFPETYMYFFAITAAEEEEEEGQRPKRNRLPAWMRSAGGWSDVLNGVGTALHHGAAAGVCCLLTTGCSPAARCIQGAALPLVLQHWFVILRYASKTAYIVILLLLEAFFEWSILSNWECLYQFSDLMRHCAAVMLFAHWLYLLAALLSLAAGEEEEWEGSDDEEETAMSVRTGVTGMSTTTGTPTSKRRGTLDKWSDTLRSRASSIEGVGAAHSEGRLLPPSLDGGNTPVTSTVEASTPTGARSFSFRGLGVSGTSIEYDCRIPTSSFVSRERMQQDRNGSGSPMAGGTGGPMQVGSVWKREQLGSVRELPKEGSFGSRASSLHSRVSKPGSLKRSGTVRKWAGRAKTVGNARRGDSAE